MDGIREYDPNYPDSELINEAYELFKEIQDYEGETRAEMLDDARFENGQVWDEKVESERNLDDRPALNVPRIDQFLNHVKNGLRASKPSITITAKGADSRVKEEQRKKYADNRQGLIRAIQYNSSAVDAYQNAFDHEVDEGRGFLHVRTQYVSDKSFDQEIIIEDIPDPRDVFMDRRRTKKDYRDAKHGFILSEMRKKVFEKKWPKADPAHWEEESDGKWIGRDDVTVATFYCIWAKKRTLYQATIENEQIVGYLDETDQLSEEAKERLLAAIENGGKKREVLAPFVMWYKMTSLEILDRGNVLGKYVPIIPAIGNERKVDGKCNIYGLVRKLKDSAKMYNYAASREAEGLSETIKAQYVAAVGQTEPFKGIWQNANRVNNVVLPYQPVGSGGDMAPPPQKQPPTPLDASLLTAKQGYVEDMKAISGIDNPSLGMLGPERSGIALQELKRGADTANMHYIDNLRITLTHVGRIVNSWLSKVYDNNRILIILGAEDEEKEIELFGRDKDGDEILLGDDDVDIAVTMGANFNTKRQESLEFMLQLIQSAPQITPLIYDLIVKNSDSPGSQEIAERLKKTIPPEILEEQGGVKQLTMQLQQMGQQLEQDKQIIEQLSMQLERAMKELEDKNSEITKDIKVANINQQGKVAVANINARAKANEQHQQRTYDYWSHFQDNQTTGVRNE